MKRFFAAGIGASIMLAATSAQAQAPAKAAAQQPQGELPAHTTNPAELPKIFAVGIRVADLARSEHFYREGMGATKSTQLTPREVSVTFPSGLGINLALATPTPGAAKGEGPVGFIFQTLDIDGLAKRAAAAGGTVERPPSDGKASGGVRVAFVRDPDGSRIEVIQFPPK